MSTLARIIAIVSLGCLAGCGASSQQIAIENGLKAATSKATGCPTQQLTIADHRQHRSTWVARGCERTYRCTSINMEIELAECQAKTTVARRPF